ncbi:hypothetical protein ACFFRR_011106 [Megaselia abdita]
MQVRVATQEDYEKVLSFILSHYYTEDPLTIGVEQKEPDNYDIEFNMSSISHGTSVVAVEGDEILGVYLAAPKYSDEAQHIKEESERLAGTKWSQILGILYHVETGANVFERFGVEKAIHGHVLGVHKDTRGKNVGGKIIEKVWEVAKDKGYKLFTTDCTSYYSARLMERLGMEMVFEFPYSKHRDSNDNQIFNPPEMHKSIKTYAKVL